MTTTTKEKEKDSERKSLAEREAEAAANPPETRYLTVSIDLVCVVDNDGATPEGAEAAAKEQITLPTALSINIEGPTGAVNCPVVGATVTGSSESSDRVEVGYGFGRDTQTGLRPIWGAPAKSQERLSPPEAIVGEVAVLESGVELDDSSGVEEHKPSEVKGRGK